MNFAILALGNIANRMAKTVNEMGNVNCYAVASRNMQKAQEFASKWGFSKAYGSYEEMLNDESVDFVYVCTPHSHHYKYAKMCLEHGKSVLVEKAFTINAKQAKKLINLAREKNLFIEEAIWTRYLPSRKILDDLLKEKIIGNVISLTANLGYKIDHVERLKRLDLAGGALLDLGVYTINFALMVMKEKVSEIISTANISKEGVDEFNSTTIVFDKKMAILHSTMLTNTDKRGMIYGDNGYIEVVNINNCEEIRVYDLNEKLIRSIASPKQITGFEYQVEACIKAIQNGKIECEEMPHNEIIYVMELMDEIRKQWNMKFPSEER